MVKTRMVVVLFFVLLLGYGGLKAIDLGTDYIAQLINKHSLIHYREEYKVVSLPCRMGATDSEVNRAGRLAMSYMSHGLKVELCGKLLTWEDAEEMTNF